VVYGGDYNNNRRLLLNQVLTIVEKKAREKSFEHAVALKNLTVPTKDATQKALVP
jgi:hypothetical protein